MADIRETPDATTERTPLNFLGGEGAMARYPEMREREPVAREEPFGGYWVLTRYADVSKAARDWKTFRAGQPFVELPDFPKVIPQTIDPPEHSMYRKVLNAYFTPEYIENLRPAVERYVDEHVTTLLEGGRGEVVTELAAMLPMRVLAALMSMPEETYLVFMEGFEKIMAAGSDPEALNALVSDYWAPTVNALIADRTANPRDPATDLMSGVLAATGPDGQPWGPEVAGAIAVLLFSAGSETTTNALTSMLHHLATHPEDQQRLRLEPELIPAFVEEILRLYPPLHQLARNTTKDVELHGVTMPAGDLVALSWAAANRDPDAFPEPDRAIFDRPRERTHLTMGMGPHQCLGAPVARLELALVCEKILARTGNIRLEGPTEPAPMIPLRSGYSVLHLAFD
ncbi:cytochrome P450 [Geodermatophilus sp. URMC 62]|uniref:cytochrome P450 n=1 Tax=Geodermatophilus sp. URMC 62 TaxID=3423414 RepID=UPI00406CE55D